VIDDDVEHVLNSVAYVSALSLWVLVSVHWAAWQAARVEVEGIASSARTRSRHAWSSNSCTRPNSRSKPEPA
jgi:hypothetical protein